MTGIMTGISPVVGSVLVDRSLPSLDDGCHAAAQAGWAAHPVQQRTNLVLSGTAAVGAMNDEIVSHSARMMGRPLHCGGGVVNVFTDVFPDHDATPALIAAHAFDVVDAALS